jgi:hypothetical protein
MKGSKKWSSVTGAIPLSGNFADKFAKRRSDSGGAGSRWMITSRAAQARIRKYQKGVYWEYVEPGSRQR